MFMPPFARAEVSTIREDFREYFPADQFRLEWASSQFGCELSILYITDVKHKIRFDVTTLCSPKEAFDLRTAKLVLMQRAVLQKQNNCMNPVGFTK